MSFCMDLLAGRARLIECAKTDPPGQLNFSEQELLQADLDYLARQRERMEQRVRIAHEDDLLQLRIRGGL